VRTAIIRAMMAVRTSETSVYSNETTRRYIPEGSKLHTRYRENLKYHIVHLRLELPLKHSVSLKSGAFANPNLKIKTTEYMDKQPR
jgi:hypothetical protein